MEVYQVKRTHFWKGRGRGEERRDGWKVLVPKGNIKSSLIVQHQTTPNSTSTSLLGKNPNPRTHNHLNYYLSFIARVLSIIYFRIICTSSLPYDVYLSMWITCFLTLSTFREFRVFLIKKREILTLNIIINKFKKIIIYMYVCIYISSTMQIYLDINLNSRQTEWPTFDSSSLLVSCLLKNYWVNIFLSKFF